MQSDTHAATPLDQAILRTLLYADVFSFPMTAYEIHHYLIGCVASLDEVQSALTKPSGWLTSRIQIGALHQQPLFAVKKPEPLNGIVFEKRQQADLASTELWPKARRFGLWLGHLPFVRMVAITGALAMRNAGSPQDDLDYLLVVKPGRVWLARLGAVIMVKACKRFRVTLCPNYVLAETALEQTQHDLFMAHELTQMIPLTGQAVYQNMRLCNTWTENLLPNAQVPFYLEQDGTPRQVGRWLQAVMEWLLSGPIGNQIETWERRRKIRKFHAQATQSTDSVLDAEHVKGHFFDYGSRTLERFEDLLQTYALTDLTIDKAEESLSPAAD